MKPIFFSTPIEMRKWFKKNYLKEDELLVGYYKVSSGKPSITWSESVDQAICFGWIDGIRKSIDEQSYSIRFTPRRPKSSWSAVNIKKVEELTKLGLMLPVGLKAFEKRKEENSKIYSYEEQHEKFPKHYKKQLTANKKAWEFFNSQPPYYQRAVLRWVMSAKQETTKVKRFQSLIEDCAAGQKVGPMRVNKNS